MMRLKETDKQKGRTEAISLLVYLSACLAAHAGASSDLVVDQQKATQVRAAYVRHLAEFTTWPAATLREGERIVIGVLRNGPDGVGDVLDQAAEELAIKAQGRPIEIRQVSTDATGEELDRIHVLYVPKTAKGWEKMSGSLADRPILTVGENSSFAKSTGMVSLVVSQDEGVDDPADDRFVKMLVNLNTVDQANLKLSFKLLRMKQLVSIVDRSATQP